VGVKPVSEQKDGDDNRQPAEDVEHATIVHVRAGWSKGNCGGFREVVAFARKCF
jgi:hypothetical protein